MNFIEIYENNKQRITTGVAMAVAALLIAFIDSGFLTWLILGVIYLLCFHETVKLFGIENTKIYFNAVVLWLLAFVYPNPDDLIYIALIVSLSMMAYKKDVDFRLLAPLLYPSISMLFLYSLYHDFGMSVLVWLVVVVALTDSAAYFVGKLFGKRAFSPTSPNKTLEGVVGGVVIGTFAGAVYGAFIFPLWVCIVVALATSVSSVFGDLFESFLKREAGVKDSGNIFPGHGGMLDRLDGYLFGAVIMTILLRGLV